MASFLSNYKSNPYIAFSQIYQRIFSGKDLKVSGTANSNFIHQLYPVRMFKSVILKKNKAASGFFGSALNKP